MIKANQTFLIGRNRYEEGQEVPGDDGVYAAMQGWADDDSGKVKSPGAKEQEVSLDIQSSTHPTTATEG